MREKKNIIKKRLGASLALLTIVPCLGLFVACESGKVAPKDTTYGVGQEVDISGGEVSDTVEPAFLDTTKVFVSENLEKYNGRESYHAMSVSEPVSDRGTIKLAGFGNEPTGDRLNPDSDDWSHATTLDYTRSLENGKWVLRSTFESLNGDGETLTVESIVQDDASLSTTITSTNGQSMSYNSTGYQRYSTMTDLER